MLLLLLLSRFSRVWLFETPWMAAHQAPPSLGLSRQEYWSGLPFPSPVLESEKWKWCRSVASRGVGSDKRHRNQLVKDLDFYPISLDITLISLKTFSKHFSPSAEKGNIFLSFWRSEKYRKVYKKECDYLYYLQPEITVFNILVYFLITAIIPQFLFLLSFLLLPLSPFFPPLSLPVLWSDFVKGFKWKKRLRCGKRQGFCFGLTFWNKYYRKRHNFEDGELNHLNQFYLWVAPGQIK